MSLSMRKLARSSDRATSWCAIMKTRYGRSPRSIFTSRTSRRRKQAIPSILRSSACRARDGFRLRGTGFRLLVPTALKSGDRLLVLYWFQAHGRAVASEYWAKYYLIDDSIHMKRSDGGMVRLMTPMLDGESADAAQARMMKLGSQVLPLLDSYIPR